MRKYCLCLFIFLIVYCIKTPGLVQAQSPINGFQCYTKQNATGNWVTHAVIELNAEHLQFQDINHTCILQLKFSLDFFVKNKENSIYQIVWYDTLKLNESIVLQKQKFIIDKICNINTKENYRCALELQSTGALWHQEQNFIFSNITSQRLNFSSIYLKYENNSILTTQIIPHHQTILPFEVELYAPQAHNFIIRATLYQKEPIKALESAQKYLLVQQFMTAYYTKNTANKYVGRFLLDGLEAGEYLLAIYGLEDEQIIAESTQEITISWRGLSKLYTEIDTALAQMKPICSAQQRQTIQQLKNREEKKRFFDNFWIQRAPHNNLTHTLQNYYQRIEYVNSKYTEDNVPGWRTERGQLYLALGTPDIEKNDINALEWKYLKLNLNFRFKKVNQHYHLQSTDKTKLYSIFYNNTSIS